MLKFMNRPFDGVGALAFIFGVAVIIPSLISLTISLFAVAAEIL